MTLKAVILDVEGTLADTEELHRRAFNAAFARHGHAWHWDEALYHQLLAIDGGLPRIRAWVEAQRPRELATLEQSGALEAIHASKSEIYLASIEDGAPLRPGVTRLLRDLRSSTLALAACSSSSRENFEMLIVNALGFDVLDWFAAVVTREDQAAASLGASSLGAASAGAASAGAASAGAGSAGAASAGADAYRLTLDRLGLAGRNAVAVEGNGRGVASAAAAGSLVIAAPGRWTRDDDHSAAALVVSDLGEVQAPFEVLRGDPGPFSRVSVEALEFWHGRVFGAEGAAA